MLEDVFFFFLGGGGGGLSFFFFCVCCAFRGMRCFFLCVLLFCFLFFFW